jgi:8-oxo-dGTP pyrophosphatase MutT (NUDIX family)
MDISFRTPEGRFNYRVCAILIDGDRLLAMKDERSPYYYLPGGRVSLHETAEDAVLREVREELGIEARIVRPLWLNQAFFTEDVTGERFHELCIYYLIDVSNTDLLSRGDCFDGSERHHRHRFAWLTFDEVDREYLYPLFIKQRIRNLPQTLALMTEIE